MFVFITTLGLNAATFKFESKKSKRFQEFQEILTSNCERKTANSTEATNISVDAGDSETKNTVNEFEILRNFFRNSNAYFSLFCFISVIESDKIKMFTPQTSSTSVDFTLVLFLNSASAMVESV